MPIVTKNAMRLFFEELLKELELNGSVEYWELFATVFPQLHDMKRNTRGPAVSREYSRKGFPFLLNKLGESLAGLDNPSLSDLRETIDLVDKDERWLSRNGMPDDKHHAIGMLRRMSREHAYSAVFDNNINDLVMASQRGASRTDLAQVEARFTRGIADPYIANAVKRRVSSMSTCVRLGEKGEEFEKGRRFLYRVCLCDPAKKQLVGYVRERVRSNHTALGIQLDLHRPLARTQTGDIDLFDLEDGILEEEARVKGSFQFVLGNGFQKRFVRQLTKDFLTEWDDPDDFDKVVELFRLEMARLSKAYYTESSDNAADRYELLQDAVTMILVASIVGPGSFFPELGRTGITETPTTSDRAVSNRVRLEQVTAIRLQPIVVTDAGRASYYTDTEGGVRLLETDADEVYIGRQPDFAKCEESGFLWVDKANVSRMHVRLHKVGHSWYIKDCKSTYGTWLLRGGKRIEDLSARPSEFKLEEGDIVLLAPYHNGRVVLPVGKRGYAYRFELVR